MKAKCYINTRDGIITIWADPGGMDYFQGFTCKEEDLQETNTTHRSLELEASRQGAKDLPTYEDACSKLRKELDELERVSEFELDDLRNEMEAEKKSRPLRIKALEEEVRELESERDALHACLKFIRSSVGITLDGDDGVALDTLTFSRESIDVLGFSVRVANCLANSGIRNLGQLASMSDKDLLRYRNFGKGSLREIRDKLAAKKAAPHLTFD
jgi:DNA-directed RNA polymerase alpha subunit